MIKHVLSERRTTTSIHIWRSSGGQVLLLRVGGLRFGTWHFQANYPQPFLSELLIVTDYVTDFQHSLRGSVSLVFSGSATDCAAICALNTSTDYYDRDTNSVAHLIVF